MSSKATNINAINIKAKFIETLKKNYPGLPSESLDPLISEQLLSPFVLELPRSVLEQAQEAVAKIFRYRQSKEYRDKQTSFDPGNYGMAMSYDFHLDENQNLKIIEINTNAAFLLMTLSLYEAHQCPPPTQFSTADLKKDVLTEMELCFGRKDSPTAVGIVDEDPSSQRLYIEFLLYCEMFRSFGWKCDICDFRNFKFDEASMALMASDQKFDFIYNRYTDFLLASPPSADLKKAFEAKAACFSPNPHEYTLLADKARLIEFAQTGQFPFIPEAEVLTAENNGRIWEKRKQLFFKPLRSFGSKQTFKGSSISRKAFDELVKQGEILAQAYVPAPEKVFETPEGPQSFKFDLRFYAYQDRVETAVARLYQGQVTNTRTPFGGFAPIHFVD